jgi:hypothetical protein
VIAHDFSTRLTQFDRWRRQVYARGFVHGVVAAILGVLFFAWYITVGSAP